MANRIPCGDHSTSRFRLRRQLLPAVLPLLLLAGCVSPKIVEFTVHPEVTCPCDPVTVRVVAENVRSDTLTFTPPASAPGVVGTWDDGLHVIERTVPFCESTNVIYIGHRGSEDVTASRRVEVVSAEYVVPVEFTPVCEGGAFTGYRPVSIDPGLFSASLMVRRATNTSDRTVRLSHDGGIPESALMGEDYPAFVGATFGLQWTASADLRITPTSRESCSGDLRMTGPPPPGTIANVPIPPLTVDFTLGCPPR